MVRFSKRRNGAAHPLLGRRSCRALLDLHAFPVPLSPVPDPQPRRWQCRSRVWRVGLDRGAFWPVRRSPARWPLGQLVGPPCSRFDPAFNALVANFTIFMARFLEWAGKDRHSVDGSATGTGIFTSIAGSHAGFGWLRGHRGSNMRPLVHSASRFVRCLFKWTHYQ
jgi:hypothetical protein